MHAIVRPQAMLKSPSALVCTYGLLLTYRVLRKVVEGWSGADGCSLPSCAAKSKDKDAAKGCSCVIC